MIVVGGYGGRFAAEPQTGGIAYREGLGGAVRGLEARVAGALSSFAPLGGAGAGWLARWGCVVRGLMLSVLGGLRRTGWGGAANTGGTYEYVRWGWRMPDIAPRPPRPPPPRAAAATADGVRRSRKPVGTF